MHHYRIMAGEVLLMEISIARELTLEDILQDYIFDDYTPNQLSLVEVFGENS